GTVWRLGLRHRDSAAGVHRHAGAIVGRGQVGGRLIDHRVARAGETRSGGVAALEDRQRGPLLRDGQTVTLGFVEEPLLCEADEAGDVARSTLPVEQEGDLTVSGGDGDLGGATAGLVSRGRLAVALRLGDLVDLLVEAADLG